MVSDCASLFWCHFTSVNSICLCLISVTNFQCNSWFSVANSVVLCAVRWPCAFELSTWENAFEDAISNISRAWCASFGGDQFCSQHQDPSCSLRTGWPRGRTATPNRLSHKLVGCRREAASPAIRGAFNVIETSNTSIKVLLWAYYGRRIGGQRLTRELRDWFCWRCDINWPELNLAQPNFRFWGEVRFYTRVWTLEYELKLRVDIAGFCII